MCLILSTVLGPSKSIQPSSFIQMFQPILYSLICYLHYSFLPNLLPSKFPNYVTILLRLFSFHFSPGSHLQHSVLSSIQHYTPYKIVKSILYASVYSQTYSQLCVYLINIMFIKLHETHAFIFHHCSISRSYLHHLPNTSNWIPIRSACWSFTLIQGQYTTTSSPEWNIKPLLLKKKWGGVAFNTATPFS